MMLMQKLQQERLTVGIMSQAAAEKILEDATRLHERTREAFGRPISKFQNTQFKLAECATEIEIGRAFPWIESSSSTLPASHLIKECSMAKYWLSEMQGTSR